MNVHKYQALFVGALFGMLLMLLVLVQPFPTVAMQAERGLPGTQPAASRPDSPEDAPDRQPSAALLAAAGDTTVTYALPVVKFLVADGHDLDQYIFGDGSPINFTIDMKGFRAHPTDPAKVTLRVWDVDQQGNPDCGPEVDTVFVNGTQIGNLTGADSQWSIVTFNIPAGTLNPDSNAFEVNVDTTGSGCWAVEVDYAEIEIPFNIAQIEASAFDDVTIKRGDTNTDITDPIWKTSFDAGGNIVLPAAPDDPIADKISGSWFFNWGAREFKYKYKLDNWPAGAKPTWQPRVEYSWEIPGTAQNSGGFQELTGWEKDFKVTLPDTLGKYTLNVTLKIYRDTDLLRTENRAHSLYVLLNSPVHTTISGAVANPPRAAWLDIALDSSNPAWGWASGAGTEAQVLSSLNTKEYSNPFNWNYHDTSTDTLSMLVNGANGNCYSFRDVLRFLAAVVGVSTQNGSYTAPNLFMTGTTAALDGNASANAFPVAASSPDRWVFGNHQYASKSGNFYDPTFGLSGTNANALNNVFCLFTFASPAGTQSDCRQRNSSVLRARLAYKGTTNSGSWPEFEYTLVTPSPTPSPTPAPTATASSNRVSGASPFAALLGSGAFTGQMIDLGYDPDGNGLFEHLQANVTIDITEGGSFAVVATLFDADGNALVTGSLVPDLHRVAPAFAISLEAGLRTIPVYFNGQALRSSGTDGPYTLNVALLDGEGVSLDTAQYVTGAHLSTTFQGLLVDVQNLSDRGVDTDARPGYNVLRLDATVHMLAPAQISVVGELMAGGIHLADLTQSFALAAGTHTLALDFPGAALFASGLDGPYTIFISFSDANYTENIEYTTLAYSAADFQPPNALFTGSLSDQGEDSNANGRYERLNVSVEAVALVTDTYTLHGILQDSGGNFIAASDIPMTFGTPDVPVVAILRFDAATIYRSNTNGPYQLMLVLTDPAGNDVMGMIYTTSAYAYTDFEQPPASFNDTFSDAGVDSDGDGFYNFLRVGIGVEVLVAGTYRVEGSLQDGPGNFIAGAQVETYLDVGTHVLLLDFDGRRIRSHGVNGPYQLVALDIKQTGNPGSVDIRMHADDTFAYAYTAFQPEGLTLTENFADHGEDLDGDGLYDTLVVNIELLVTESSTYYFNSRLVDANGEEIVWASGSQYLSPGIQIIALAFNGQPIYGNGVDGPYLVKDLSIYSSSQSLTRVDAYTTSAYAWTAFEPSAIVQGMVRVGNDPVPNAQVFIGGVDSDTTDSSGAYRLAVFESGAFTIQINADPMLSPWEIWVNGTLVVLDDHASIEVVLGEVTEVNFVSTLATFTPPPTDTPTATPTPTETLTPTPTYTPTETPTLTPTETPTPTPTETPLSLSGRMVGGGSAASAGNVNVLHAFVLHCQPGKASNYLIAYWGKANVFLLKSVDSAICLDDPAIDEAPPVAGFDTHTGTGSGIYNGSPGATIAWTFTDAGEPGIHDRLRMVIRDKKGNVVLLIDTTLMQGNHQALDQ